MRHFPDWFDEKINPPSPTQAALLCIECAKIFLHLFQLVVKGYSHKQHILLQRIIEKMTSFEIDPQRFELLKDNVSENFVLCVRSSTRFGLSPLETVQHTPSYH